MNRLVLVLALAAALAGCQGLLYGLDGCRTGIAVSQFCEGHLK